MIERKRKTLQKKRKRRVKIRTLFLLSMTLIFNTYAWFLYATTVTSNTTIHVNAWDVDFQVGDTQIERIFPIEIPEAYPGMPHRTETITVYNSGEKVAALQFNIQSARIFDTTYTIVSTHSENPTEMTSDELLTSLANDYPFRISITADNTRLATGQSGAITILFEWLYDTDNDEQDTYYGTQAYDFYQTNSSDPAIQLTINLTATQVNI